MLKGVSPLLSPDLLHALASMGHGDEMALADANFPAATHARRMLLHPGCGATQVLGPDCVSARRLRAAGGADDASRGERRCGVTDIGDPLWDRNGGCVGALVIPYLEDRSVQRGPSVDGVREILRSGAAEVSRALCCPQPAGCAP